MAKRGVTIFCEACGYAYLIQLPGEVPTVCGGCQSDHPTWRTSGEPRVAYVLTNNDRRFLRALRITVDE